jgi:hypothetical protein
MLFERYFSLVCVVVVALNLLYGRHRASALVNAGRVTNEEVSTFTRSAFALVGGSFFAFFLVQETSHAPDMLCLLVFPPRRPAESAVWLIQLILSGTTIYWLWFRGGADVLARLAPAFTHGSVLERKYSTARVGLFISAVVIFGPLMGIVSQLVQPKHLPGCAGI